MRRNWYQKESGDTTQNDLKRSRDEIINATYNLLLAKYRILDAMGLTVASIVGDIRKYYHRVGLYSAGLDSHQDTLPLIEDNDHDGIPNSKDLCNNTKRGSKVLPFGCIKSVNALDMIRLK